MCLQPRRVAFFWEDKYETLQTPIQGPHHRRDARNAEMVLRFPGREVLFTILLATMMIPGVLFLIPLPWWGPVLAPTLIALGMAICGTLMTQKDPEPWPRRGAWIIASLGALLAVVLFNLDAAVALGGGAAAVRAALPEVFRWPWFILALLLMSAVLFDLLSQVRATAPRLKGPSASAIVREQ